MTELMTQRRGGYLERPSPSSLADVISIILDKGLVIDAYVRVSLVGIELLTIDARIVIASVDTYLRFAEATNRLDLYEHGGKDLPELFGALNENGAKGRTRGAIGAAKDKFDEFFGDDDSDGADDSADDSADDDDDDDRDHGDADETPRRRPRSRSAGTGRRREPARAGARRRSRSGTDG